MRCTVRVPTAIWTATCRWLRESDHERLAYLLARCGRWHHPRTGDTTELLVSRALPVPDTALTTQTPVRVEVDPEFTRAVLVACYEGGLSLIDIHTHPFADSHVAFSSHDLANMAVTHRQFLSEIPQDPPALTASLVLGRNSVAGAYWDPTGQHLTPLDHLTLLDTTNAIPLAHP